MNNLTSSKIKIISGLEISEKDLREAIILDFAVYAIDDSVQFTIEKCIKWHNTNPFVYFMLKDIEKDEIVGYVNMAPVTKDCYEMILSGQFWDIDIPDNLVLPYENPGLYYLNFTSVVIHPDYRSAYMILKLIDAIAIKLIELQDRGIYIKSMIADALTEEGERFCQLFGMKKIIESGHQSKIYQVTFLPPNFTKLTKAFSRLFELYQKYKTED